MCGICGFIGSGSRDDLIAMTETMRHRGPDESGFFWQEGLGIGHRRLKIIDLVSGQQPMFDETRQQVITFNGEIYNFPELKKKLTEKGFRFTSQCDTEVLLNAYRCWGAACLGHLNGMFAFGILDIPSRRLFIARDRFGQKPLYYYHAGDLFIFASEIKSILAHPAVNAQVRHSSLGLYLFYEFVPEPATIFQNMYKVPAGHYIEVDNGNVICNKYWDVSFTAPQPAPAEDDMADELRRRLRESIKLRLISDVPLGVFLSGGIDSSTVVALLAECMPAEKIKTFSIGFAEKSYDETPYFRLIAEHYGTDHHEQTLNPSTMTDIIPEIFERLDEPLADPSIIPTFLLSRFTRQHVTVALGGDGGDELFAGYDPFLAHYYLRNLRIPAGLCRALQVIAEVMLPASEKNVSIDFIIKRTLSGLSFEPGVRNQVWMGSFPPAVQNNLLNHPVAADVLTGPVTVLHTAEHTFLQKIIYNFIKLYLQGDILTKVDRASMMNSLEVRSPFLDHEFAGYANSLPDTVKLRRGRTKHILRRMMRGRVPDIVLARRKKGFGIPLSRWFRHELKDMLYDTLTARSVQQSGLFRSGAVRRLIEDHISGRKNNSKELWTLLVFHLWRRQFCGE